MNVFLLFSLLNCCLEIDSDDNLELKGFSLSMRISITDFPINGKPALFSYALDLMDNAVMIGGYKGENYDLLNSNESVI